MKHLKKKPLKKAMKSLMDKSESVSISLKKPAMVKSKKSKGMYA